MVGEFDEELWNTIFDCTKAICGVSVVKKPTQKPPEWKALLEEIRVFVK